MRSPGMLLGGLILLASPRALPALDISIAAHIQGRSVAVNCVARGIDSQDLIEQLDHGGTVRFTWLFRMAGSDDAVVLYARRDALGEGYIAFEDGGGSMSGPMPGEDLVDALSVLDSRELDALGPWREGMRLEGRLFLDYDLGVPPVSLRVLSGESRDQSPWTLAEVSGGGRR